MRRTSRAPLAAPFPDREGILARLSRAPALQCRFDRAAGRAARSSRGRVPTASGHSFGLAVAEVPFWGRQSASFPSFVARWRLLALREDRRVIAVRRRVIPNCSLLEIPAVTGGAYFGSSNCLSALSALDPRIDNLETRQSSSAADRLDWAVVLLVDHLFGLRCYCVRPLAPGFLISAASFRCTLPIIAKTAARLAERSVPSSTRRLRHFLTEVDGHEQAEDVGPAGPVRGIASTPGLPSSLRVGAGVVSRARARSEDRRSQRCLLAGHDDAARRYRGSGRLRCLSGQPGRSRRHGSREPEGFAGKSFANSASRYDGRPEVRCAAAQCQWRRV